MTECQSKVKERVTCDISSNSRQTARRMLHGANVSSRPFWRVTLKPNF